MDERVALLIDGANLFATAKELNFAIDYAKLLKVLRSNYNIVRANYYTAVRDTEEQNSLVPLIDWLSYTGGYKVVTKFAKEYRNSGGETRVKGNMDVQIAVDAMAMSGRIDHYILGTGDGDFVCLVNELHRHGLSVSAISTIQTRPPMIASALRREVDEFIEIAEMIKEIRR